MPGAAVDTRPTVPGILVKQLREQRRAQRRHRGADRGLHHGQRLTLACGQRRRGQLGQAGYLARERLLERGEEPPFSPSEPAWESVPPPAAWATGATGLASQIASFTATIFSLSSANAW
jgi:hypothetical protein